MRRLLTIIFVFLIADASPLRAADPNQIFGTILGEIERQIERNQQKKQLDRLRPLWAACSNGDVAACDRAARVPNISDQARAKIWRMREAAEQRPHYERNFYACQKLDRDACVAALADQHASDVDRINLQNWQRTANQQHQQALNGFRQNERNCYAGSVGACDAALAQRHLDDRAGRQIESQRARIEHEEEQRQLREQQRKAALRDYIALRDACAADQRDACLKAAAHPQVPQADLAFLKRRDRELAPITERVAHFVAGAQAGGRDAPPTVGLVSVLLGLIAIIGAAVGLRHVLRTRAAPAGIQAKEPPGFGAKPPIQAPVHSSGQTFPLTGHMPTDVRRALFGA